MSKIIRLERPLVVLDLETTGTKVQTDRIVEISLLKLLPDGTNEIKTRRLNPGMWSGSSNGLVVRVLVTCRHFG
jgi:DNA polymerase III subunit epsilon